MADMPAAGNETSILRLLTRSLKAIAQRCRVSAVHRRGQRRQVAEHEHEEAAARLLNQRIEFLLGATKTGLDIVDRDFNLRFVNAEWQRVYGDPACRKCYEYFMGRDRPCDQCGSAEALKTNEIVVREGTLPRENHRPVQTTSVPLRAGEEGGLVGQVTVDISKRKLAEQRLLLAQKLESIGQLAGGIAHEINTPAQYIRDNTQFLEEAFRDLGALLVQCRRLRQAAENAEIPEQAVRKVIAATERVDVDYLLEEIPQAISHSLEGVDQVAKIVYSMRQFSRPGGDQKQAVDLNQAIEHTLTICRNEWKYVAEAVMDLDPNLPLVICYPAECNQALLNLILNAADAIREKLGEKPTHKGTLTLTTRRDADWVEIRVADTGTGIPEPLHCRIFDPFFTTKQVGRGTGQGLAITHSIVTEKHGGTISFETEVGQGTTFVIRLPVHWEPARTKHVRIEKTNPIR